MQFVLSNNAFNGHALQARAIRANQASEGGVFQNYNTGKIINGTVYARTGTNSYRLTSSSSVGNEVIGPAKSIRVYTGDVVSMEVYGKYLAATSTNTNPGAILATALQSAFQLSSGGATEKAYNAVQSLFGTGAVVGTSGFPYEDSAPPKAYLNYILFDDNYVPYDFGYDQIGAGGLISGGSGTPNKMSLTARARKPGYAYIYLSNENGTIVEVYFDDLAIKHVKSPILQHNEYYPYGMQTANSWTRDAVTANNFLSNGGTELNPTTQLYDLDFRNYDPVLGRMNGVDPMAGKYSSLTPYNYSFNNPISFTDPSGADPDQEEPRYNPNINFYLYNGNGRMGIYGLTYDDRAPNPGQGYGDYNCGYCWRKDNDVAIYSAMGGYGFGGGGMGAAWSPGQGGVAGMIAGWNPDFGGPIFVQGRGWMSFSGIESELRKERWNNGNADGNAALNWAYRAAIFGGDNLIAGWNRSTNKGFASRYDFHELRIKPNPNNYTASLNSSIGGPDDPEPKKPTGHNASDWYNTTLGAILSFGSITLLGEESLVAARASMNIGLFGIGIGVITIASERRVSTSSALDLTAGIIGLGPAAPLSLAYFGVNFFTLGFYRKSIGEIIDENYYIVPISGNVLFIPKK